MVNVYRVVICFLVFGSATPVFAHGTQSHDDEAERSEQRAVSGNAAVVEPPVADAAVTEVFRHDEKGAAADISFGAIMADLTWSEFPTLHPMIVHVPVMLIPMAFLLAVIGLFIAQRTFLWLALSFAALGLAGGLIAAFPAHPHTQGLTQAAQITLEKHDFFAYTTLWLTLLSVVVALVCLWKPARLLRFGLAVMLLLSGLSVSITGHYGGSLAYVHGIGPQGRFLSGH